MLNFRMLSSVRLFIEILSVAPSVIENFEVRTELPDTVNQWLQRYDLFAPTRSKRVERVKLNHDTNRGAHIRNYQERPSSEVDIYEADGWRKRMEQRFDEVDKHHGKVEAHEYKEVSFVYPVLLALLILGALFVPFLSLFFFLSVTAFNCNGFGSSFQPVAPFLGRRRRRRRKRSLELQGNTTSALDVSSPGASILWDELDLDRSEWDSMEEWRAQLASSTAKLRLAVADFADWISEMRDA